jgi:hypothetical protein
LFPYLYHFWSVSLSFFSKIQIHYLSKNFSFKTFPDLKNCSYLPTLRT